MFVESTMYLYYVPDMTPCIPLSADLLGSLIERIVWIEDSFHPDNFHVDPNQPLINNYHSHSTNHVRSIAINHMTTRKMSYTKSCKIIEMCSRLKFQKLIPEGNLLKLSCGISERLLLMIKACFIYFISDSKLYVLRSDVWLHPRS